MRRLTTEEFINQAIQVHGNKYDYSLSVYTTKKDKLTIICPIHGEFYQSPDGHLRGQGCPKCKAMKTSERCRKSYDKFVEDARKVHGDKYDYSKFKYVNSSTKGIIICSKHGEFEQLPSNHLAGKGCSKCMREIVSRKLSISQLVFLQRAQEIHPEYDYSNTIYNGTDEYFSFKCPKHGEVQLKAASFLYRKCGCPKCHQSKGESKIRNYLESNNIKYIEQFKVRTNEKIRVSGYSYVDFYLPDKNIIIEYNGIQHYKPVDKFGGELKLIDQKKRDTYVKYFCYLNGIYFLEISYLDENIDEILTNFIQNPKEICPDEKLEDVVYLWSKESDKQSNNEYVLMPKELLYNLLIK